MKQNFALTLSFDGIGLLHRAFPGWNLVGDVTLDVPDLSGELANMRQTAQALDASGLRTKLVLPNDQIRYLTIDAPSEEADIIEAIKSALSGATPYPVDDLAYDWSTQNGQIYIAAVARETLIEAEAFATEHQFNPMSFVGQPENGDFSGEPFFGATLNANGQGISEDQIERDTAPIRVIGASKLPEPAPEPTVETDTTAQPETTEAPEHEAAPPPESAPQLDTPAETDISVEAPEATPDAAATLENDPDFALSEPGEDSEDTAHADAVSEDGPADDTVSDEISAEPTPAFASIRAERSTAGPAPRKLAGVSRTDTPARITLSAAPEPEPDESAPGTIVEVTGIAEASLPEDDTDALSHDIRPGADLPDPDPEVIAPAPAVFDDPLPLEVTPDPDPDPLPEAPPAQPSFFTRRSRRQQPDPTPGPAATTAEERERMTVFGAREKTAVGGKPRFLGLMLTAVLLLFLIGVAAWASIFLDDGIARFFRDDDPAAVASLPQAEPAETTSPVELAALDPTENLSVLDDPATEILSRVNPSDLSPDEAKARYAATGIWQLAPEPPATPTARDLEDVYQTSLDPDLSFQDAVALPDTEVTFSDGAFFTPASPPSADTTFTLDSRGFVLATPEGALTPDAVRVFAGRPAVVPPSATKPTETVAQPQVDVPTETTQEVAALRPRARPENAAEQIERSELNGRTRNELAALRPKLRPASAQEAAEEARKLAAAQAAAAQAQAEASAAAQASTVDLEALEGAVAEAVAQPDPFAGATSQAVAASLKPNTRPRNFDNIVQRTKRNQQKAEAQQQPVRVAAAQKVTPKIPTAASVSKQATQRNALKFKRVNLIGVYGTPNNRRALVRMNNGRYKKVKVGDRLDGGKVSAIGDGDLRYKKGGRTVVLKMPRG